MKFLKVLTIAVLFLQFPSQAQFFKHIIIKTRPFQDFVILNPDVGFEKPVGNRISVEAGFMYRNRNWNNSGVEWTFGKLYNGDGFRVMAGGKYYFGNYSKNPVASPSRAPFGWFATLQLAFNHALTYGIEQKAPLSGIYLYTADSEKDWLEVKTGLGIQFYALKAISFELYAGPLYQSAYTEQYTITEEAERIELSEPEINKYADAVITPFVSFTVGYFIKGR